MHTFTIDLASLLTDGVLQKRITPTCISTASIQSVYLATESLECAITLATGELILYRLSSIDRVNLAYREVQDRELIIVEHVMSQSNRKYTPYFVLAPGLGAITSSALSDIGELI